MAEENNTAENPSDENTKTPAEQLAEVKVLIKETKKEAEAAKSLLVLCKQYEKETKEIKEKAQVDKSDIDKDTGIVQQATKTITEAEQKSTQSLADIEAKVKSVEDNVLKMETAFTKFEKINEKIEDPVSGLDNTLVEAQKVKTEIDTAKTEADKTLKQIADDLTQWSTRTGEMDQAYTKFQEIGQKVFDAEGGLASVFTKAEKIKDDTLQLKTKVEGYEKESGGLTAGIKKLNDQAEKDSDNIVATLKAMTGKGLGTHFESRKDLLITAVRYWNIAVWGSFILLAVAVFLLFAIPDAVGIRNISNFDPLEFILYRFAITSPILFLIGFCLTQYSKERDLLERYSFKAIKGFTLENYITVLNRNFSTTDQLVQDEILLFSLTEIQNIYEEPFHPIKKQETKQDKVDSISSALRRRIENGRKSMEQSIAEPKEENPTPKV